MFKQDDCRLAGEPGGPERTDPRVNIGLWAGPPGQMGAGWGGLDQGWRQRQRQDTRCLRDRRWTGDMWSWRQRKRGCRRRRSGDDIRCDGLDQRRRRFWDGPVLGGQFLTCCGLEEPVGGAVVEAAVLQRVSRSGQPEPAKHKHGKSLIYRIKRWLLVQTPSQHYTVVFPFTISSYFFWAESVSTSALFLPLYVLF